MADRVGAAVVGNDLVAGADEARHHVQTHFAEADEAELHRVLLEVPLKSGVRLQADPLVVRPTFHAPTSSARLHERTGARATADGRATRDGRLRQATRSRRAP